MFHFHHQAPYFTPQPLRKSRPDCFTFSPKTSDIQGG